MKSNGILTTYLEEIADHNLLGREGEIALAKEIEEREIEVWRTLLAFSPAVPLAIETLAEAGIVLPCFEALARAAADAKRAPSSAHQEALARQAAKAAPEFRERDRDRDHLNAVRSAIEEQSWTGKAHAKWLQHLGACERMAANARREFVTSNLRFVVNMCRRFAGLGVPLEDLIQEGNIGLIKGVDRFDYRQGYRFSTYAGWWIRHAIGRAVVDTSRTVRVPVHVLEANREITRVHRELTAVLAREPTNEEIAERLEMPTKKVELIRNRASNIPLSLDEPLGDEGITRLDSLFDPANDERSLLAAAEESQEAARIPMLLESLTDIQADVLRKRFGLTNDSPMTLREIGEQYGLSRERIRQIESKALSSLRAIIEKEDRLPAYRATLH